MKNFFKVTLLLVFIATFPAFQNTAYASTLPVTVHDDAPEMIGSLSVIQTGPGQFTASWTSNCEGYLITLIDETGGGSVPVFVLRPWITTSVTLGGYLVGHTYRFVVTDCDSTFSQVFVITY